MSRKFEVKEGLRHRDSLSPMLFNIIMVIRQAKVGRSGLLHHRTHQCMAFADDIIVLAPSSRELCEVLKRLITEANEVGLEMNETKTKCMKWGDEEYLAGKRVDGWTEWL